MSWSGAHIQARQRGDEQEKRSIMARSVYVGNLLASLSSSLALIITFKIRRPAQLVLFLVHILGRHRGGRHLLIRLSQW
jgi:hypothetical protein